MNGERAVLFATDPPYLVDYDGSNHPTRNKDWSQSYGNTWDDPSQGAELYDGFISAAVAEAITEDAAWYCWHASRRQAMPEACWEKAGAFVHQQIIWGEGRSAQRIEMSNGRFEDPNARSASEGPGRTAGSSSDWCRRAARDAGALSGPTSEEKTRIKALERENRELRQANEILKKGETIFRHWSEELPVVAPLVRGQWSNAYFAQAELDRPFRK